jgi:hypothetical protein
MNLFNYAAQLIGDKVVTLEYNDYFGLEERIYEGIMSVDDEDTYFVMCLRFDNGNELIDFSPIAPAEDCQLIIIDMLLRSGTETLGD